MDKIVIISLAILICCQMIERAFGDREVLIRDKLVLVLCDQIHEYQESGNLPEPVKKMPKKYKKVKPGNGEATMNGYKVVIMSGNRRKRAPVVERKIHPILDFMYED